MHGNRSRSRWSHLHAHQGLGRAAAYVRAPTCGGGHACTVVACSNAVHRAGAALICGMRGHARNSCMQGKLSSKRGTRVGVAWRAGRAGAGVQTVASV